MLPLPFLCLRWTLFDTWITLWMVWEVNGVLIFLKLCTKEAFFKQYFLSGSVEADAWCLVLAVTCSWRKKRIIYKPLQASFRCQWARGGKCTISTELAQLTHAMEGVSLGGIPGAGWDLTKTWLLFVSSSCVRQCNMEDDKFRISNGACSCGPDKWDS